MQKYGFADARDVLERASARETAARVAAGALAKALLAELGVAILSHVVALGGTETPHGVRPRPGDLAAVDASTVRCFDADTEDTMVAEVKAAAKDGDSLAASSRCSPTVCPSGWAATSTGTENSTHSWRRPS